MAALGNCTPHSVQMSCDQIYQGQIVLESGNYSSYLKRSWRSHFGKTRFASETGLQNRCGAMGLAQVASQLACRKKKEKKKTFFTSACEGQATRLVKLPEIIFISVATAIFPLFAPFCAWMKFLVHDNFWGIDYARLQACLVSYTTRNNDKKSLKNSC